MKTPLFILLAALLLAGCATPAEKEQRRVRLVRERAEWREANYQYFLEDYAHSLGRAVSELNETQREESRQIFNREHPLKK